MKNKILKIVFFFIAVVYFIGCVYSFTACSSSKKVAGINLVIPFSFDTDPSESLFHKGGITFLIMPVGDTSVYILDKTDSTCIVDTILLVKRDSVLIKKMVKKIRHYSDSTQYVLIL